MTAFSPLQPTAALYIQSYFDLKKTMGDSYRGLSLSAANSAEVRGDGSGASSLLSNTELESFLFKNGETRHSDEIDT